MVLSTDNCADKDRPVGLSTPLPEFNSGLPFLMKKFNCYFIKFIFSCHFSSLWFKMDITVKFAIYERKFEKYKSIVICFRPIFPALTYLDP